MLDIDTKGVEQLRKNNIECVSIGILIRDFNELKNRLINRGLDSIETINKRVKNAEIENERILNSQRKYYNYVVYNDKLSDFLEEINNIFVKE